ncbi:hypothetical protein H6F67_11395 [Microcoleus sp. FACHB-1515]|uniref:hypothetical protein n=1 Tax=Cyanophyceae TaxID=3028117 RepID=UPI00168941B5|nr:hypothetical protein [Microcoleus sp. FACHB-1515]MBD2090460.1 hypothetical protein [Microcoleus sp. FACHB-1515]
MNTIQAEKTTMPQSLLSIGMIILGIHSRIAEIKVSRKLVLHFACIALEGDILQSL